MTRGEALREGAARLRAASVSETPALDASLILASVLGLSREALLTDSTAVVSDAELSRHLDGIAQRALGRPVAHVTGRKEFWGRTFALTDRVLVPRPDTELLVELSLSIGDDLARRRAEALRVHECCVGSGAVAVSLAADRPAWKVSASDISEEALDVARGNATLLLPADRPGGALVFSRSDLLAALPGIHDLIAANPPYVESPLARDLAAAWGEPLLALDGGKDGLDLVRRLVPEAFSRLAPGGWLLVEADPSQAGEIRSLFAAAGFGAVTTHADLSGHDRVTCGERP